MTMTTWDDNCDDPSQLADPRLMACCRTQNLTQGSWPAAENRTSPPAHGPRPNSEPHQGKTMGRGGSIPTELSIALNRAMGFWPHMLAFCSVISQRYGVNARTPPPSTSLTTRSTSVTTSRASACSRRSTEPPSRPWHSSTAYGSMQRRCAAAAAANVSTHSSLPSRTSRASCSP